MRDHWIFQDNDRVAWYVCVPNEKGGHPHFHTKYADNISPPWFCIPRSHGITENPSYALPRFSAGPCPKKIEWETVRTRIWCEEKMDLFLLQLTQRNSELWITAFDLRKVTFSKPRILNRYADFFTVTKQWFKHFPSASVAVLQDAFNLVKS